MDNPNEDSHRKLNENLTNAFDAEVFSAVKSFFFQLLCSSDRIFDLSLPEPWKRKGYTGLGKFLSWIRPMFIPIWFFFKPDRENAGMLKAFDLSFLKRTIKSTTPYSEELSGWRCVHFYTLREDFTTYPLTDSVIYFLSASQSDGLQETLIQALLHNHAFVKMFFQHPTYVQYAGVVYASFCRNLSMKKLKLTLGQKITPDTDILKKALSRKVDQFINSLLSFN
ncbi:MAG: hypothetical protein ACFFBD_29705, partial [Candidatus Hodarchaeota archaeon]